MKGCFLPISIRLKKVGVADVARGIWRYVGMDLGELGRNVMETEQGVYR